MRADLDRDRRSSLRARQSYSAWGPPPFARCSRPSQSKPVPRPLVAIERACVGIGQGDLAVSTSQSDLLPPDEKPRRRR
jgi:hypothetical protein